MQFSQMVCETWKKCVLRSLFKIFTELLFHVFNAQSPFLFEKETKVPGLLLYMQVPLKWKWRHSPISHMNFMTIKRPQQFIYSSFKIGHTHANKAVRRIEGVGGWLSS